MRIGIAAAACAIVLVPWAAGPRAGFNDHVAGFNDILAGSASAGFDYMVAGRMSAGAAVSVRLAASEFAFTPKDATSAAGDVTVVVHNGGAIEHNFVLEDRSKKKLVEIPVIEPGQTIEIRASLPAGGYVIYCSLPGHRDAGMAGTLTVR